MNIEEIIIKTKTQLTVDSSSIHLVVYSISYSQLF